MKKYFKYLIYCFLFLCLISFFSDNKVNAKNSSSSVFDVIVGKENILPVHYSLEDDNGVIRERVNFAVTLIGKEENGKSYKWEHTLCYKISGQDEMCEIDITSKDEENGVNIVSNQTYNYTFYDTDMPFYSESLTFEYIKFKNKFICLEENTEETIELGEMYFNESDLDYKFNFDINKTIKAVEVNGKNYINPSIYNNNGSYYSSFNATFVNNSGSTLVKENAPTYKFIIEACGYPRDQYECSKNEYTTVTSNGNEISITPYIGNITYPNILNNLKFENRTIQYEYAIYKTKLECISNCSDSRVSNSITLSEDTYYFKYSLPVVDENNTIINSSNDEVNYVKNSEVTISVSDSLLGIDESSLTYYIVKPYSNYCNYGTTSKYNFVNGVMFTVGNGLNGGYCMYYTANDKLGNTYTSDFYIFYFDNLGPEMTLNNTYDSSKYYNEIILKPTFSDYSNVKEKYYLWSKEIVSEENYLDIKNKGINFNDEINSNELSDGIYYLYILAFDSLNNYKYYDVGVFNIDKTGLDISEVNISFIGDNSSYSNTNKVKVYVSEMGNEELFKCGFLNKENVSISDLTLNCKNNVEISYPNSLEGSYSFYVYLRDRANNYSLIEVKKDLLIDTLAPRITTSILYDDNEYHVSNEIGISVNDLNNYNELKYGWFIASKNNVTSNDLCEVYENNEIIYYPNSYYGEYKLYLKATDNLGNENFYVVNKTFKIDTDIVSVKLIGSDVIKLIKGEKYKELGASAYKGSSLNGGRTSKVDIESNVDINKAGTYYVTYSSGEGNFRVSVTRKVIVKSDSLYIAGACTLFALGSAILVIRLFIKRKID